MNEETLSSGFFGEDITVDIYSDLKEFYTPANGYAAGMENCIYSKAYSLSIPHKNSTNNSC